jgi:hypothetical protein
MNPVHNYPLHFPNINCNIFPSTRRSSEWPLPFSFSDLSFVYISYRSHTCYMSHPSRPWFDHPNNIWWSVQVTKLLIMQSSPASCHFLLGPNILFSALFQNTLNLCFFLRVRDQVSQRYKITGKVIILYILIFKFLEKRRDDKILFI